MKKLIVIFSTVLMISCFSFVGMSVSAEDTATDTILSDYEQALILVQDTGMELTEEIWINDFQSNLQCVIDFLAFNESMLNGILTPLPDEYTPMVTSLEISERLALMTSSPYYYVSKMTLDGDVVFCLDPTMMAGTGLSYNQSSDWELISWSTRVRIWNVVRFGYQIYGTNEYYIASQMMVWSALGFSVTIDTDYSAAASQIERNISNYYKTPSFSTVPQEMSLHVPVTITDTNGVLSTYSVNCKTGVTCSVSGNNLTITIDSIHYDKNDTITFTKGSNAVDNIAVVWTLAGNQSVAKFQDNDPSVSSAINPRLATGDLKINKLDEYLNDAEAGQGFAIWFSETETNDEGEITPTWYKGEYVPAADGGYWYTGSDGDLNIVELLPVGYYIIEEVSTTNPYELNSQPLYIQIKLNELTEVEFYNNLRTVSISVNKVDTEETWRKLDGAEFVITDITDAGVINPITVTEYHLKTGVTQGLTEVLNAEGTAVTYTSSRETVATIENGIVTGIAAGYTTIQARDAEGNLVKQIDLIVSDDLETDYEVITKEVESDMPMIQTGITVFSGVTGGSYLHIVDTDNHNYPIANIEVTIYDDPDGLYEVSTYTTNEYGVIDTSSLEPGVYYYYHKQLPTLSPIPFIVEEKESLTGLLQVNNLKWGRTYEACEVTLPTGYDYLTEEERADGMSCTTITMDLDIGVDNISKQLENILRRIDVKLYKQNDARNILLNGATFEIWDIFEEGVNLGELIDPEFPMPMIKAREYLGEYITGALLIKETTEEMIDPDGEDTPANWQEVPAAGVEYLVSTEEDMSIYTIYSTNADGEIIQYLSDGKYYVQKASDEDVNPNPIEIYYISKGTIFLPELKYGHQYLICETKAPSGYYISGDGCEIVTPETDYGVTQLDNYRINQMVSIAVMGE